MKVLEAPRRMGRRAQAADLLKGLPEQLSGKTVEVSFPDDAYTTTSFLDELIRFVLCDLSASRLILTNVSKYAAEIAQLCATDLGVQDRLTLELAPG